MNSARRIISISGFIGLVIGLIIVIAFLTTENITPASAANGKSDLAGVLTATPTPVATCSLAFYEVEPGEAGTDAYLRGISAISANDIWAVGGKNFQPLSMHWNGSSWAGVPVPTTVNNGLEAVAAISANDVWAVGQSLVHWNGTEWVVNQQFSYPLHGIDALNSNDIWAVGEYVSTIRQSLIKHWDGTSWTQYPNPSLPYWNVLYDVAVVSANDAWAVGQNSGTPGPLILHWDGTQWSDVTPPALPTWGALWAVDALAANDIWAVGDYCADQCNARRTLTMHWDGSAWSVIPSIDPRYSDTLLGVTAIQHNDVWAVGTYYNTLPASLFAMHWNGTAWSEQLLPNSQGTGLARDTLLRGIISLGSNNVWSVGGRGIPEGQVPAIYHYSTQCPPSTSTRTATITPTHTVTGTPPTLTRTPTFWPTPTGCLWNPCTPPPTATDTSTSTFTPSSTPSSTLTPTVTLTPTTCAIQFSDVPGDHTFAGFIRCLACRGIITGYPDGTFRPGENVTRGQIAKIVTLAKGWTTPVAGQTFEDVPEGSTFWSYIERMALHEIMSGYPCGNPEPCVPPGNRPYFRPGSNASRGQLIKVVASSANWTDPVPLGQQTFQDVPPSGTFWSYIEQATMQEPEPIIQGYLCGSQGEPCIAPDNRPYFRPGNPVTRGQASKIVTNTFFSGCQTP